MRITAPFALAAAPMALAAAVALAPLWTALPAQAQDAPSVSIEEDRLAVFVEALRAVGAIEERHLAAFQTAETDQARHEIAARANAEMIEAIEAMPEITVEEYVGILQQAQADPALNARIVSMLEG